MTVETIETNANTADGWRPEGPPVLLVGNFGTAGNFSVGHELAMRLRGLGRSVFVTTLKRGKSERLFDILGTIWKQRHQFELAQVDVYSGLGFHLAEAACWALKHVGKPYVLSLRGGNLPVYANRYPQRVKRLFHSARAVTAPSRYLQEALAPFTPGPITLLPNPIELIHYPFQHRTQLRPRLVWLRAFEQQVYNPPLAVRVMARLAQVLPDAHLTMYGADKKDGSLAATRQLAEEMGVADRIDFAGAIAKKDVPAHLAAGDILLNTSNIDNTPISVMEAMALGLCVVSTDVGGIPYLVTDGQQGLLVRPDDDHAMAAAVIRLMQDPQLAGHLSDSGRRFVQSLDWSIVLPQWDNILRL